MEVNGYSAVQSTTSNTINKAKSNLSIDDFLQIMAAEIKNQNPMGGESGGGGSKTDYLSQLAQFTMLEQMNTITDGINQVNMLNQVSLIGKEVSIYDEKGTVTGTVDKVKFFNSTVILQVNGKNYPIDLLMEVGNSGSNGETGNEDSEGSVVAE